MCGGFAGELGCSHITVRRYLAEGGWVAYRGRVAERFRRHAGNADVVRQELEREKGIRLTLRTVEREVRHLRRELEAFSRLHTAEFSLVGPETADRC